MVHKYFQMSERILKWVKVTKTMVYVPEVVSATAVVLQILHSLIFSTLERERGDI